MYGTFSAGGRKYRLSLFDGKLYSLSLIHILETGRIYTGSSPGCKRRKNMAGNVKGSKMLSFMGNTFMCFCSRSDAHRTCLQDWPGSGRHHSGAGSTFSGYHGSCQPVSYTHLDVYKRQAYEEMKAGIVDAKETCGEICKQAVKKVKLAPIVSSAKSAQVICRLWDRKYKQVPDFVVV